VLLPKFSNKRRAHRFWSGKICKITHSLLPGDGNAPWVARKASAVSDTSVRISPFFWATSLLRDLARIHFRNLRVSHRRHAQRVLLRRFPGGVTLPSCALSVVQVGAPLSAPLEVHLRTAAMEAAATWAVRFSVQVSSSSGCHHDVLLPSGRGLSSRGGGLFSGIRSRLSLLHPAPACLPQRQRSSVRRLMLFVRLFRQRRGMGPKA
jgi:hypothetical protein